MRIEDAIIYKPKPIQCSTEQLIKYRDFFDTVTSIILQKSGAQAYEAIKKEWERCHMKILNSTDGNLVEFELEVIGRTEKAIQVSDGIGTYWIPKSQLEDEIEHLDNGLIRIVIPEWLAHEKEMI